MVQEERDEARLASARLQEELNAAREETRLAGVTADAEREKAEAAAAAAREADDAADNAATKFAAMQHRVAQLSGKIGGMSRAARSATDVAEMEVTGPASRRLQRKAGYRAAEKVTALLGKNPEPAVVAKALTDAGILHALVTETPAGQDILFAEKMQLATALSEVWDADLAAECAVELGLTDWQLNELRFKLIYVWDAERERWIKRVWFQHAGTGKTVYFPEPIVSKHRWKPIFTALCEKHRVELVGNGSVAQRSFSDGLALLLTRTDSLLPAPDSSGRTRVMASVGWDAIKHAGRHLVHGGVKLASFKEAVSTQSELNFVTTNIWRDNDDHAGLRGPRAGGGMCRRAQRGQARRHLREGHHHARADARRAADRWGA